MSQHTPGPWQLGDSPRIVCDPVGQIVAVVEDSFRFFGRADHGASTGDYSREEAEANAILTAAAPDLLEAAEAVDAAHEAFKAATKRREPGDMDALFAGYDALKAAIAKARGEGATS